MSAEPDPLSGRPVGLKIEGTTARKPEPVVLEGRFGRIEKLDAERHGAALWQALNDDNATWAYLGYGPFADEAAFAAWLAERSQLGDPYSYAIVSPDHRAIGISTLMEITPAQRLIEDGNFVCSPGQ